MPSDFLILKGYAVTDLFEAMGATYAAVINLLMVCVVNDQMRLYPWLAPWLLPLAQMSLNGSTWATVSVALERFITVVQPELAADSSLLYTLPTLALTVAWNIPRCACGTTNSNKVLKHIFYCWF